MCKVTETVMEYAHSVTFEIPGTYPKDLVTETLMGVLSEPGDDARVDGNGDGYRITLRSHNSMRDMDRMKADFLEGLGCGTEQKA